MTKHTKTVIVATAGTALIEEYPLHRMPNTTMAIAEATTQ